MDRSKRRFSSNERSRFSEYLWKEINLLMTIMNDIDNSKSYQQMNPNIKQAILCFPGIGRRQLSMIRVGFALGRMTDKELDFHIGDFKC